MDATTPTLLLPSERSSSAPRSTRSAPALPSGGCSTTCSAHWRGTGSPGMPMTAWSRLLGGDGADLDRAERALQDVFGRYTGAEPRRPDPLRPARGPDQTGLAGLVRDRVRGHTFAVRTRRMVGASLTAHDLDVSLGAALLADSAGVNLDRPEVTVQILAGPGHAFCSVDATDGAAGLPLGTGGRALAMLSGGFDSPVAAWHVLQRSARARFAALRPRSRQQHRGAAGGADVDGALGARLRGHRSRRGFPGPGARPATARAGEGAPACSNGRCTEGRERSLGASAPTPW